MSSFMTDAEVVSIGQTPSKRTTASETMDLFVCNYLLLSILRMLTRLTFQRKWIDTYKPLFTVTLSIAQGFYGHPENVALSTVPGIFLVRVRPTRRISSSTRAAGAFRVKHAQMISREDFLDPNHPFYHPDHPSCVGPRLENHFHRILASGMPIPLVRTTIVVIKLDFNSDSDTHCESNNISFMMHQVEDKDMPDRMMWMPCDWLDNLKNTVAAGKGRSRDGVSLG